MHNHVQAPATSFELLVAMLLVVAFFIYPVAAFVTNKTHRKWPSYRCFFWGLGVCCAGLSVVGPFALYAQTHFKGHMMGHLLLGMLAPLLLVFARPMTLLLRTVKISTARKITRLLKSPLFHVLSNPATAAGLNIGGLWLLYTTDLFELMHQSLLLYSLIHLHVFLAGYLFTLSIIYIDVTSHRLSYLYRALVLILAIAGHKILSKYIYAHPPKGVPQHEAEIGALWMYYGGDLIELVLIIVLCYQWYKASAPRGKSSIAKIHSINY